MSKEEPCKIDPYKELRRAIQGAREAMSTVSAYHESLSIALTLADKNEFHPFELNDAESKLRNALGALYNVNEWLDSTQKGRKEV